MEHTLTINTSNGNKLINVLGKFFFYTDKNGKFLKSSNNSEWDWLCSRVGNENVTKEKEDGYNKYTCLQEWKHIDEDYKNYKSETCRNGGDYGFDTFQIDFCGMSIKKETTTAEFDYDEYSGCFCSSTNVDIYAIVGKGIFKVGNIFVDSKMGPDYLCTNDKVIVCK